MQSCDQNHHHQPTNTQLLQARCPSCRPTNSVKALKVQYHIPFAHPKLTWGLPTLWPLKACLSSALWCQYPIKIEHYYFQYATDLYQQFGCLIISATCCQCKWTLSFTVSAVDRDTGFKQLLYHRLMSNIAGVHQSRPAALVCTVQTLFLAIFRAQHAVWYSQCFASQIHFISNYSDPLYSYRCGTYNTCSDSDRTRLQIPVLSIDL